MSTSQRIISIAMLPELYEAMMSAAEIKGKSVSSRICKARQKFLAALGLSEEPTINHFVGGGGGGEV